MQTMELDRISEMEKFIQTYSHAIQILGETMNQVESKEMIVNGKEYRLSRSNKNFMLFE